MRFSLDSNILVYSVDQDSSEKRHIARLIIARAAFLDTLIATQVLGEFVNAVRRRNPSGLREAIEQAETWSMIFPTVATTPEHIVAGGRLALRHQLQFWDSVILAIARSEQVDIFVTEDMDEGFVLEGMTLLNPFLAKNRSKLDALLEI